MPDATPNTIPEILRQTAARYPDRLALRQPSKSGAQTWTWSQYLQAAEEIAAGLHALGIARGDHVAICSETRAEFYLADLIGLEVRIDGRPAVLSYLGPPEWDGVVQLNVALPAGTRTGLVPIEVFWLGQPITAAAWMRVIPSGPAVPRVCSVTDGVNLLSGARIVSRTIKVVMEETSNPERLQAAVDGTPVSRLDVFCTDPLEQRYEINLFLPDAVPTGPHQLHLTLGRRTFAPVAIEVV